MTNKGLQPKRTYLKAHYLSQKLGKQDVSSYYQDDFLIPNNKPAEACRLNETRDKWKSLRGLRERRVVTQRFFT